LNRTITPIVECASPLQLTPQASALQPDRRQNHTKRLRQHSAAALLIYILLERTHDTDHEKKLTATGSEQA